MEYAATCEVCSERFSTGEHDPLALPCGHTFCRDCLARMINMNRKGFSCPTCRRVHSDLVLGKLPVIYKLLSVNMDEAEIEQICESHGDKLAYWCQMCQTSLCGLCLFRSHPQDHDVIKKKAFLEEEKRVLKEDIQAWQRDMEINNKAIMQKALTAIKEFYRSQTYLSRSKRIIGELLPEIDGISTVAALSDLQTKIISLKMVAEAANNDSCTQEESTAEGNVTHSLELEQVTGSCGSVENVDGRRATVEWYAGKLQLSAFSENPSHCDLLLKMPSQVFLQLSIGREYLGQVTIQPFYHLRRAQLFAAMCMGTFGVSYAGSPFRLVQNKGRPREYLSGGGYANPRDGMFTNQDLMSGLEWDGEATGESRQGAVLGVIYGNGVSGFGICSREQVGGTFKCLFGKVVNGIDVVKAAVRHHPVSEVVITKCGLVFPDIFT
ncbi:E3 ubiquitin-protein ligase TRIM13-like [Palaemon carinicauda]|uniref:E3 ubiquitin-protein ligase TRIM13-like n=1 Tax=Palaemon carinicauda TaxID=392227 RepID=UPI0035B62E3A